MCMARGTKVSLEIWTTFRDGESNGRGCGVPGEDVQQRWIFKYAKRSCVHTIPV